MTDLPTKPVHARAAHAIGGAAFVGPRDGAEQKVGRPRSASGRFVSPKPPIALSVPWKKPDSPAGDSGGSRAAPLAPANPPAMPQTLVGALRVTRPLPRFMKSALAGLMVAYGDLESSMEAVARRAMGIEPDHWRLAAGPGLGPKIRVLKTLFAKQDFAEDVGDASARIWLRVEAVELAWTTIAHRRLFMLDQSKLLAGDLPDNGADPEDRIYSLQRLQELEAIALSLAETFQRAAGRLEGRR